MHAKKGERLVQSVSQGLLSKLSPATSARKQECGMHRICKAKQYGYRKAMLCPVLKPMPAAM